VNILDFIVCDDIRYEVSNKITIIGAYADQLVFYVQDVTVDQWPKQLKLGFFIRIKLHEEDPIPDEFHVEFVQDGKIFTNVRGNFSAPSKITLFTLALVSDHFKIPGKGQINFNIKIFKNKKIIFEGSPDYRIEIKTSQDINQMSFPNIQN